MNVRGDNVNTCCHDTTGWLHIASGLLVETMTEYTTAILSPEETRLIAQAMHYFYGSDQIKTDKEIIDVGNLVYYFDRVSKQERKQWKMTNK